MKCLYVTTIGTTMHFFKDLVKELIEGGDTVDIAANEHITEVPDFYKDLGCKVYQMPYTRSPFKAGTFQAIRQLRKVVADNGYDVVHCHTPVAAVCARLACRPLRKKGVKVIYTAHGFHFCKTAPKKNWLLFYPVEWLCAWWTDVLITINESDYALASKHFHAKSVRYVPGVGIDLKRFAPAKMTEEQKQQKREELGLKPGEKLMVSVGALGRGKNHILVLQALLQAPDLPYSYRICGRGGLKDALEQYIAENHLEGRAALLGRREDIAEILQVTDLFVFPSDFEGLPVALMEAIATKVMVVCSDSRGNTDLVKDERCMFYYRSVPELLHAIQNVDGMPEEEKDVIREDNYSRLLPREKTRVMALMKEIYHPTEEGD